MVVRLKKQVLFRDSPTSKTTPHRIAAFYRFAHLSSTEQQEILLELQTIATKHDGRGLVLVAPDGWNGTVSGGEGFIDAIQNFAMLSAQLHGTEFKLSMAEKKPFRQFKVEQRGTIIDMGPHEYLPDCNKSQYLSPQAWDEMLQGGQVTILDVRNSYEWCIGTFQGAITPPIEKFNQFPDFVANSNLPKDKPILMFCTGGVRCEKASILMKEHGYHNVYQLEGGILRYLEERPHSQFLGECFVFDNRVAVDQQLRASERYRFCPHCGNAGDRRILCVECGVPAVVCAACEALPERQCCSKNCAYHFRRRGAGPSMSQTLQGCGK